MGETYEAAGVSIGAGERAVDLIKDNVLIKLNLLFPPPPA